ncbi:GNAT family N-acetyltransferase [Candidatus Electronema sp. JC]|uniref:GNAT family N-acetyltransferase n=1 Tax=Candidatus Electronema sp. JC TaxID=3401570 RepID=UPI003B43A7AC
MNKAINWCSLLPEDIDQANMIADSIHTTLPERPDIFIEKRNLFPEGCCKLVKNGAMVGYGISHPWTLYAVPPLDEYLVCLPKEPNCIYIHDVAVLPQGRGLGALDQYVEYIKHISTNIRISSIALVSVYGTDVLWKKFGFFTPNILNRIDLIQKISSYGESAKYMVLNFT